MFNKFVTSLSSRLAAMYAGFFFVSIFLLASIVYVGMNAYLNHMIDSELRQETLEAVGVYNEHGLASIQEHAEEENPETPDDDPVIISIFSPSGSRLYSSMPTLTTSKKQIESLIRSDAAGNEQYFTVEHSGRIGSTRALLIALNDSNFMLLEISIAPLTDFNNIFLKAIGYPMPILLLIILIGGKIFSNKSLKGIKDITQTARAVNEGTLDKRVSIKDRGDELNTLVTAFNGMLDRITTMLHEMQELTDNMAHDLRTPLTKIRIASEAMVDDYSLSEHHRYNAALIIDACDQLLNIVNVTMDIAEAESGIMQREQQLVSLKKVVENVYELFLPVAELGNISLFYDAEEISVMGDEKHFFRALTCLVDNALKYTPENGIVQITLAKKGQKTLLSVQDTGSGIAKSDQEKVFTKFYRSEKARSQKGNGLGLALANALFTLYGGKLSIDSEPPKGTILTVTFNTPA